jgi:tRNA(Ile)-lysidine synthase
MTQHSSDRVGDRRKARAPSLVEQARRSLVRLDPAPTDMVVAVSGGPDSVALLRALAEIVPGRLVVAHLNHCLRGAASDEDEAFVARLAETLPKAVYRCERRDMAALAAGDNQEAAARRARYQWLACVAQAEGVTWVATGHTADDQAETVLFRLLRGTGLSGLAGIAPRRSLAPEVEVVRPLLAVSHAEVLEYLGRIGQDYREDESNADLRMSRNRIRHELLPLLVECYNPRVQDVLCRLASQAVEWQRALRGLGEDLLRRSELPRASEQLVFNREVLAREPAHRVRDLWRMVWEREGWPRQAMGFAEWNRLADLCGDGPLAIDLPGRIRARRRGAVIQVGPVNKGV